MAEKLALYFNDTNGPPRILDAEIAPKLDDEGCGIWQIGRLGGGANIVFDDRHISRHHAYIRCYTVTGRSQWQIQHSYLARNKTFKDGGDGVIVLPAGKWLNINDFDRYYFVYPHHGFTATTAIDETFSNLEEDEDGPETINETMERAKAEFQQQHGRTWPDVASIILNGPDGMPDWLWRLMLMSCALIYVLVKYKD